MEETLNEYGIKAVKYINDNNLMSNTLKMEMSNDVFFMELKNEYVLYATPFYENDKTISFELHQDGEYISSDFTNYVPTYNLKEDAENIVKIMKEYMNKENLN